MRIIKPGKSVKEMEGICPFCGCRFVSDSVEERWWMDGRQHANCPNDPCQARVLLHPHVPPGEPAQPDSHPLLG
jgi:hypothetical protein